MEKKELLCEGNTKNVYATENDSYVVLEFKDELTDGQGARKGKMTSKGEMFTGISSFLFQYLENYHIPTHFVERLGNNEVLVRKQSVIPLKVRIHNVAAGDLSQRFKLTEGDVLSFPIVEYYLKSKPLGNPIINETHALALGFAQTDDIRSIGRLASKTNAILRSLFERRGLTLVNFSLEFGTFDKYICVCDEISPDTCRIWDRKTNRKFEKERFMQDLPALERNYKELFDRLTSAA